MTNIIRPTGGKSAGSGDAKLSAMRAGAQRTSTAKKAGNMETPAEYAARAEREKNKKLGEISAGSPGSSGSGSGSVTSVANANTAVNNANPVVNDNSISVTPSFGGSQQKPGTNVHRSLNDFKAAQTGREMETPAEYAARAGIAAEAKAAEAKAAGVQAANTNPAAGNQQQQRPNNALYNLEGFLNNSGMSLADTSKEAVDMRAESSKKYNDMIFSLGASSRNVTRGDITRAEASGGTMSADMMTAETRLRQQEGMQAQQAMSLGFVENKAQQYESFVNTKLEKLTASDSKNKRFAGGVLETVALTPTALPRMVKGLAANPSAVVRETTTGFGELAVSDPSRAVGQLIGAVAVGKAPGAVKGGMRSVSRIPDAVADVRIQNARAMDAFVFKAENPMSYRTPKTYTPKAPISEAAGVKINGVLPEMLPDATFRTPKIYNPVMKAKASGNVRIVEGADNPVMNLMTDGKGIQPNIYQAPKPLKSTRINANVPENAAILPDSGVGMGPNIYKPSGITKVNAKTLRADMYPEPNIYRPASKSSNALKVKGEPAVQIAPDATFRTPKIYKPSGAGDSLRFTPDGITGIMKKPSRRAIKAKVESPFFKMMSDNRAQAELLPKPEISIRDVGEFVSGKVSKLNSITAESGMRSAIKANPTVSVGQMGLTTAALLGVQKASGLKQGPRDMQRMMLLPALTQIPVQAQAQGQSQAQMQSVRQLQAQMQLPKQMQEAIQAQMLAPRSGDPMGQNSKSSGGEMIPTIVIPVLPGRPAKKKMVHSKKKNMNPYQQFIENQVASPYDMFGAIPSYKSGRK